MFLLRFCVLVLWPVAAGFAQNKTLLWNFPIGRPHAGVLLANGTQGLMVWGRDNQLNITIGRAGFWDHRGGNAFSARTTFGDVKKYLESNDEQALKKAFEVPKSGGSNLGHPQQLGGGRLEIQLPVGWKLQTGELILERGEIKITVADVSQKTHVLVLQQSVFQEVTWIELPRVLENKVTTRLVAAWESVKSQLSMAGVRPPETWESQSTKGFTQTLPADEPLSIAHAMRPRTILISSSLGTKSQKESTELIAGFDQQKQTTQTLNWWAAYWRDVPRVELPDAQIQEIIDYGLYKQACATPPNGLACALQGPFMEDYQLPPWSNDYHFNINIQMIYWPALATNRLAHFDPLWAMIKKWMPTLKQNGESFFGKKGALMLPHAVDDRCQVVGTFWSGTIDHACTAWMAQMAWQNYQFGLDQNAKSKQLLTDVGWPLLEGAFEGYFAMLEEVTDAKGTKRFSLPVSVSPEYRGASPNAWGRDASFQLAALHRVCRILPLAAAVLGKTIDPRWADVAARLPAYTTFEGVYLDEWKLKNRRIALWEGMDLIESHRHHSHLGGIYPFQTISIADTAHREIIKNSLNVWKYRGAGGWSGWCVPWASTLYARTNQTEAAVSWLHYWKDNYTNEGRGTLHNANTNGTSIMGAPDWNKEKNNREIMQLDAGFGALNAALELLVQNRDDGIYVFPNLHRDWKSASFDGIRTEGAFLVSAKVLNGSVAEVSIKSLAGGLLRVVHGLGDAYLLNGKPATGLKLERTCAVGEVLVLKPL